MTPQEQEMIEKLADKLAAKQDITQDPAAAELINHKIASQRDIIYRLSQLALAQELALTEMKKRNDYLQSNADFYQQESKRGTMSRMFGESRQPPRPPVSSYQPSAFGGFMQTAAGVAAGMVAGSALSHLLFSDSHAAEPIVENTTNNYYQQPDDTAENPLDNSQTQESSNVASAENDATTADDNTSSFLAGSDDYTQSYTGGGWNTDTGFGNPDDLSFSDSSSDSLDENGLSDDSTRWGGEDDSTSDDFDFGSDDSGSWGDDDSW